MESPDDLRLPQQYQTLTISQPHVHAGYLRKHCLVARISVGTIKISITQISHTTAG